RLEVIDFTVEGNPDRTVSIRERLPARFRQINDRKAAMAERADVIRPHAPRIRAAMLLGLDQGKDSVFFIRARKRSGNSAHIRSPRNIGTVWGASATRWIREARSPTAPGRSRSPYCPDVYLNSV